MGKSKKTREKIKKEKQEQGYKEIKEKIMEKFNFEPFSYKDIEPANPETGEFKVLESSGKKWVGRPERPPAVVKAEQEEMKRAGLVKLIEQLPEEERKKIREQAGIQAAEMVQKKQHVLNRADMEKEFNEFYRLKEWELAREWLADHPEKQPEK